MSKWKRLKQRSIADRPGGFKGITPESWHCIDCDVDTAPGTPGREQIEKDFRKKGRSNFTASDQSEIYTVHTHVWEASGVARYGGCLCIGCLETRLGRQLTPADFMPDHPFNTDLPGTPRLLQRQGRLQLTEFERLFGGTVEVVS